MVTVTPRPLYPRAGVNVAENFAFTGIRSSDRPSHIESLYRLSYPAHIFLSNKHNFSIVNQLLCSPSCILTHIFVKVCELEYLTGCTKVSLLYSCFHTKWCTLHTNLKIHTFVACVIASLRARTVVCMCIKFFLKVSGLIIYL